MKKATKGRKCRYCGRNFKTIGGRRQHETKMHRLEKVREIMREPPAIWSADIARESVKK